MQVMDRDAFCENIFGVIDRTVDYNEPVCITGRNGNAVLLSEEDYRDLVATLELCSVPGMKEKILEGGRTPVSECLTEDKVQW